MAKKEQTKSRYGEYCELIDGKLYGSANVPTSDGKYKKKRKRFDSKFEAKQWAMAEIAKERIGSVEVTKSTTFGELAAWYKRHYLVAPVFDNGIKVEGVRDWKRLRAKIDKICEHLGGRQLLSITSHDLKTFAAARRSADGVTTATINRDFALMRAMFRMGKEANKLLNVPRFPINKAAEVERDRVLSFDEEMRLLAACVETETVEYERKGKQKTMSIAAKRLHLAGVIIFAVDTAMRAGEIFKLDWADVDMERDIITVQFFNSKTQKTRQIGMTPRVKAVLLDLSATPPREGLVFKTGRSTRAFRTACVRAKITDLHFHDLRHTATTRMIRAGVPHTEVMKITGHTQIKTFLRYLNLGSDAVQNAAMMLGEFVSRYDVIESDTVN